MRRFLQPACALALGLCLGLGVTALAGENPLHVARILAKGAFGSWHYLGMTLFYATPLVFTGLSVAVAFHAGLFNIGAEGQLTVGALAAAAVGILAPPLPLGLSPVAAGLAAAVAGGAWGFIPGWLRARRGSHEVINTIMLNFIAAGLTSYVALYLLKDSGSQNPQTRAIAAAFSARQFAIFAGAPVSAALPLGVIAAGAVWLFLWRTASGFELRAVGQSEAAARSAGIDCGRVRVMAMSLAGGLAGLVGVAEVLGNAGRFKVGFSPEYGFTGIAVALLGRNHPGGILLSALLLAALHKGAGDLDLETDHVTRELSQVLQAAIILSVAAEGLWDWTRRRRNADAAAASPPADTAGDQTAALPGS